MNFLKTPDFWYRTQEKEENLIEKALTPLCRLYEEGGKLHRKLEKPQKAPLPVLCVGNLVAGGSGKTPVSMALMKLIRDHKLKAAPYFLTRGFGGTARGALLVEKNHSAAFVGDEALQLAGIAPVIIAKNRYEGAVLAHQKGADLALMDDGMQNRSLEKDIRFMVIDGTTGFGNGKLLPAGPLREKPEEGLNNADAFILIGKDLRNASALLPPGKPVFHARIEPVSKPDPDKSYIAFAGIGRPEKFYASLKALGLKIIAVHSFPDHYRYSRKDIVGLAKQAHQKKAALITTEKDKKRLESVKGDFEILTLPVELVWEDPDKVISFLKERSCFT